MGFVTCTDCGMGYFDTKSKGCPNPRCSAYVKPETSPQSPPPSTRTEPPPRQEEPKSEPPRLRPVQRTTPPPSPQTSEEPKTEQPQKLGVRLNLPPRTGGVRPPPKKTTTTAPSGPPPRREPRRYAKSFKIGGDVPGFDGVNAETTREQRRALATAEREYATSHPEDANAVWSVTPLLDADVGPAKQRAETAIGAIKERNTALQDRISKLSEEDRRLFDAQVKKKTARKLFEMSGTATRPGDLGGAGRDAIVKALDTVDGIDPTREPHDAIYFKLNEAMAINDGATGVTKDMFGKARDKAVALPVLFPIEPRADAMPPDAVGTNLGTLNSYVSGKLGEEGANPIELMAKQYMMDVTIHPCQDANGRSSLLATFPLAKKFGLPWPLVTKTGSEVFHCQGGQATDDAALHPADVMAYIAEGMKRNLDLQEQVLNELKNPQLCNATGCGDLAWMRLEHKRCGKTALRCEAHLPKSICPNCSEPYRSDEQAFI